MFTWKDRNDLIYHLSKARDQIAEDVGSSYICLGVYYSMNATSSVEKMSPIEEMYDKYPVFTGWIKDVGNGLLPKGKSYKLGESWAIGKDRYSKEWRQFKVDAINEFIERLNELELYSE